MSENWSLIFGGGGIASIIFTFYKMYADNKLKEKEHISKITAEKEKEIFSQKIEVYESLYEFYLKYYFAETKLEVEHLQYGNTQGYEFYSQLFQQCIKFLEKNIFYISSDLELKYQKVYYSYLKNVLDSDNIVNIRTYCHEDAECIESHYSSAYKDFFAESEQDIYSFFKQIKIDFDDLKNKYYKQ